LISWYLEEKAIYIRKVVLVIDARLWPQKTDLAMFEYIQSLWLSLEIVLSKVDKLSKNEANKAKNHVQKAMFWQSITWISSLKNEWIKELSQKLKMALDETWKI
jgi:GTP-binding protein EngB required for normal cell division